MRFCCRCERPNGPGPRELRPYGPGGKDICAECGLAPANVETTRTEFESKLGAVSGPAILTEDGPKPASVVHQAGLTLPCVGCTGKVTFSVETERPTFFHTMPYCKRFDATNTADDLIVYMRDCGAKLKVN